MPLIDVRGFIHNLIAYIMANKRDLKKQIRYMCGDIATECLIAADYVEGIDKNEMRKIVAEIAVLQENALSNTKFCFDKVPSDFSSLHEYNKAKNVYFKKAFASFREKFNSRIQDIVNKMNAALPQAAKDLNKQ